MRHAWHVAFEVAVAFVLIAGFAVLNAPRTAVLAVASCLLLLCAVVGWFRVWSRGGP